MHPLAAALYMTSQPRTISDNHDDCRNESAQSEILITMTLIHIMMVGMKGNHVLITMMNVGMKAEMPR